MDWRLFAFLVCALPGLQGADPQCDHVQGYYVGIFGPDDAENAIYNAEFQASFYINKTNQRVYGLIDDQNLDYASNGPVYLTLQTGVKKKDCRYESDCSMYYTNNELFEGVLEDKDNNQQAILSLYIQDDKFVLAGAQGTCTNVIYNVWWYVDTLFCLCCGEYQSGGPLNCPKDKWQKSSAPHLPNGQQQRGHMHLPKTQYKKTLFGVKSMTSR